MRKFLFLLFTIALFNLDATQFKSSTVVTPNQDQQGQYYVEIQLEKFSGDHLEIIAEPKFICFLDEPTTLILESKNKIDFISIQTILHKNDNDVTITANFLIKEKEEIVLSFDNTVLIKNPA